MAETLFVCFYYSIWLLAISSGIPGLVYDSQEYNLLPPLLKELSERTGWREGTPGPQSVAIKYMKRLYKMSATKEGFPRIHKNAEYNTVRLIPPKTECKPGAKMQIKGHLNSLDLTFNADSVSALEQNLQSILLYSINKQYSSFNMTCTCYLEILDDQLASSVCPKLPHTFELQLQNRQRWVEIDVTSFLQPFVSNRHKIHLSFNLTCLRNNRHYSVGSNRPLQMIRSLPYLLLYLNDTSNKAYHRSKIHVEASNWSQGKHIISNFNGLRENLRVHRSRRGQDIKEEDTTTGPVSYNFSALFKQFTYHQNECELHQFRLSFSQLNWDKWIIAPHRYNPNYCKGDCPRVVGHKYGSIVHTMVQNIIYEKLDSSVPRPSCVPSEYRPMSVLTIEPDNSIAYKEYQDMIATKCTCR
ncbi:growth/differentiation factor 9 [Pseudophryne corroboree]|uniref:growth/differentiation factor 9 n=1 Tax=Pseudophryne corroboree TaxID=495146 RepID=UPI003081E743